jgi:hypothetical protein
MKLLYAAMGVFNKSTLERGLSWDKYIKWSKLIQLTEVVSFDGILNQSLVEPDYANSEDWNFIHCHGIQQTGFFTTQEYVLRKSRKKDKFNFLTVVLNPDQSCQDPIVEDFEFVGYDLMDQQFGNSALTNCGGFDETFLPEELNQYGLIDDYIKVYDIRKRLLENNPEERHADTNVIAMWRHKEIGR